MKRLSRLRVFRLLGLTCLLIYQTHLTFGQCPPVPPPNPSYNCGNAVIGNGGSGPVSGLYMNTPNNLEIVFDSFEKYAGSVVLSGATRLHVVANQLPPPANSCKWELAMFIDNSSFGTFSGLNDSIWFPDVLYGLGSSGPYPRIYELEVRVTNPCGTPVYSDYRSFNLNSEKLLIISGDTLVPAGNCGTPGVNGAGSYLTHMGEFTFNVDYKVKLDASTLFGGVPNPFAYNPGRYKLNLRFCLIEIP